MPDQLSRNALAYHSLPVPGKLAISATRPLASQHDLSFAYSRGWPLVPSKTSTPTVSA